jgi:hypothetical protein
MRVLAAAGSLAMVGGMIGMMAPAAHADATVLESCQANLLSTITPALGATDVPTVIKGGDKTAAPGESCTGALSSTTGGALQQAASLSGVGSCPGLAGNDPNAYPFNGKMSIKYANIDPVSQKNYASSAYIRLGSSQVGLDVLHVTGIVTKGEAVGADVTGDLGFSGWWDKKFTATWDSGTNYAKGAQVAGSDEQLYKSAVADNLGNDPTTTSGFWTLASPGPVGPESFNDLLACVGGGGSIPFAKAFTTGTTTALGTVVNSAITLQFP